MTFPASARPIASSELTDWANREITPLLRQLRDPEKTVHQGNHVIQNLDPLGVGTVRYNVRLAPNPQMDGAAESSAIYIRNDHGSTWDTEQRFQYAIYGEQDQGQNLAGGSWSKVIHRGWGDAHFVALMAMGDRVPIADASNTTPIVLTFSRKHGFGAGNIYQVTDVTGNTAANSDVWYYCRVTGEYTLELWNGDVPIAGNGIYTGGGQATCIDPTVGYEAAHFSEKFVLSYYPTAAERAALTDTIGRANGGVGYLSSIQAGFLPGPPFHPLGDLTPGVDLWESGMGRNKLFEALVENDQLFSGGCFVASDTPNRAFIAIKRQYFQDAGPLPFGGYGVYAQFSLEEAYYNPQPGATAAMVRWALNNDASMQFNSLLASASSPQQAAPPIRQFGSYWDGAAAQTLGVVHFYSPTTTPGLGIYQLYFGPPDTLAPKFTFQSDGVSVATTVTATSSVVAPTIAASASYQGLGAAATSGVTTQDSPTLMLEGAYWDGAASVLHGCNMVYDVTAVTPAGRLLMRFGTPGFETLRYIFGHDGTADFQNGKLVSLGELRGTAGGWKVGLGTTDYGSGNGVIGIAVATTAPTVTPGGGGIVYVDAGGSLRYLGPGGTNTAIAPP